MKNVLALAAAAAMCSQASAGALALAWERYDNFTLTGATVIQQLSSGDTSASYNGAAASTLSSNLTTFGLNSGQGPDVGAVAPLTNYVGIPLDTAVSYANRSGSVLLGTLSSSAGNLATATLGTEASSQSNTNSSLGLTVNVAGGGKIGFDFDAVNFIRFLLDSSGLQANAAYSLIITVQDLLGNNLFAWLPNGGAGGIFGGSESADPFSLNRNVTGIFPNTGGFLANASAHFSAQTDQLAAGTYVIGVDLLSNADVQNEVPEPGTLLLTGLGLIGLGLVTNRKVKK